MYIRLVVSAADVLTNHNNNARTGLISAETVLTPSNVAELKVLYQSPVDGQIYAQPLCVSNQLVEINSGNSIGAGVKFAVPTVFAGKVYVGTSNSLVAFGL
jgi:hypothetical protein